MFTVNVNANVIVHTVDEPMRDRVTALEFKVTGLTQQGAQLMSLTSDLNAKMTALDEATDEIAADLEALRNQVAGGVTPADAEALVATLDMKIARLKELAKDPENPVPPVEPV